ncbi:MAG: hypothetical protein HYS23_14770 [Geobacter sp.]|nr:hypothetical protein [Geobacter sp.]
MLIRVLYADNTYDMVKDNRLDDLISARKVISFERSTGWVAVGRDPLRGVGGTYWGPERRSQKIWVIDD